MVTRDTALTFVALATVLAPLIWLALFRLVTWADRS